MRGDSLRDFYAKSLAVLGLAVLGALGAVVDYWPAAFTVPTTAAVNLGAAALRPLSTLALAAEPVSFATSRTPVVVTDRTPVVVSIAPVAAPESVPPAEVEAEPTPSADLVLQAPEDFTGFPETAIDLSAIEAPPETFRLTTIAPEQAMIPVHQGFLAGITAPIVGATTKAGSAVVDGLTTVGSAVGAGVGAVGAGAKSLFRHLGLF
jgi:hypothetical protein